MVIFATYLYSKPDRSRTRPPAIRIASYEKTIVDNGNGHLNPLDTTSKHASLASSRPDSPLSQTSRSGSARGGNKRDD